MRERCFCGRCVPNDLPRDPHRSVCSACGEEIRFGVREGQQGWWHRLVVDHAPIHGHTLTRADQERWEAELDVVRYQDDGTEYTTRGWMLAKMNKAAREAAEEKGEIEVHPIPPPEIRSTPIDVGDPRLPGGAKSILNLARKNGWTAWATYARGPRVHGTTQALIEMSDNVLVRARLDDGSKVAVASWWTKNGKPGFEFAYIGHRVEDTNVMKIDPANSNELKAHLKGPEPEPLPLEQETL